MRVLSKADISTDDVDRLVKRIPFFNEVASASQTQFDALMSVSEVIEAEPGETIINKGDTDEFLYFLLKGQLAVFLEDAPGVPPVNAITPGTLFGILSMITQTPRSAYIKADTASKHTLLLKLNTSYFSGNSSMLDLQTKLAFYRMALHNVRWTLETNKMAQPHHPLVKEIMKLPMIKAPKGSEQELGELRQQVEDLSNILLRWNDSATSSQGSQIPS